MSDRNEDLVREAYEAYGRGDVDTMLTFVDPQLKWTYLDPSRENPEPQTCHGRGELAGRLRRQAAHGLKSQIEEITAHGDQVLVVIRSSGPGPGGVQPGRERNYLVLTLDQGRITKMRACRDQAEARAAAGLA